MDKHQSDMEERQRLARKIEFLDNPERWDLLPPEKFLELLPIKKADHILDLGAGTGYLALPAARMVDGIVYALDFDPNMLEMIDSRAKGENITNIQLLEGSIDDIPLAEASVNIVLASLVLHEVKPLSKVLEQIKHVLKEDGYLLCFEYDTKESPVNRPPMHVRIPSSTMEEELKNAGFSIVQKIFPEDYLYIFIVKK